MRIIIFVFVSLLMFEANSINTCVSLFQNYDDSPFNDLSRLKMYPAHLSVFLRYLIDNDDPSTLVSKGSI